MAVTIKTCSYCLFPIHSAGLWTTILMFVETTAKFGIVPTHYSRYLVYSQQCFMSHLFILFSLETNNATVSLAAHVSVNLLWHVYECRLELVLAVDTTAKFGIIPPHYTRRSVLGESKVRLKGDCIKGSCGLLCDIIRQLCVCQRFQRKTRLLSTELYDISDIEHKFSNSFINELNYRGHFDVSRAILRSVAISESSSESKAPLKDSCRRKLRLSTWCIIWPLCPDRWLPTKRRLLAAEFSRLRISPHAI
ncbi:hypothetical protein J6590_074802 [Homalodisca vitripennis]|nr:hypothetical protein J6590_074802 [Homalodisca vitripennis]